MKFLFMFFEFYDVWPRQTGLLALPFKILIYQNSHLITNKLGIIVEFFCHSYKFLYAWHQYCRFLVTKELTIYFHCVCLRDVFLFISKRCLF